MAIKDVNLNALQIVNEVQLRLGINETSTLTSTKNSKMLMNLLNDVIAEVSDFGDWPQMFTEVKVTASASVGIYEITASSPVKNIFEIAWGDDTASMEVRTIEDLRRLQRLASFGTPRQFAIVGVSGDNPLFRTYPIPNQTTIDAQASKGGVFDCAIYVKPAILTSANASTTIDFPARMIIQGLYAKALLEESGSEPTPQFKTAYAEYIRMRQEALNRFTADTGTDIYITPTGSRYA